MYSLLYYDFSIDGIVMSKEAEWHRVSVCMPPADFKRLRGLARRLDISVSELVRRMAASYNVLCGGDGEFFLGDLEEYERE